MRADTVALLLCSLLIAAPAAAAPASRPAASQADALKPGTPRYDLRQLVTMARATYPGVEAARFAIKAMEREVFRAKWAWLPSGNVTGLLAPVPDVKCFRSDYAHPNPDGTYPEIRDSKDCTHTSALTVNTLNIAGVLGKIDLTIGMPLFTFFKLSSAQKAAQAEDKLEVDVTRAYWGLKLAREILYSLREGRGYIVDAEKSIEKDVDEDAGEYTMTDLLRIKTARAEIDSRLPEVEKLERMTLVSLRALTGHLDKPFDVDTQLLEVLGGQPMAVGSYLQVAAAQRPDLKLLEAAVRARRAAVNLERARFFPDFLFVAMVGYGRASSIDWPQNAFASNPFNYFGGGFGLAMSWKLEPALQWGAFRKAQFEENETKARQAEGTLGVQLEIHKAHAELVESRKRLDAAHEGEKSAHRWLVATSQNLAAGLAETRDLTDSLVGYFTQRLRYLQAIYDVNVGWSELGRAIGAHPSRR